MSRSRLFQALMNKPVAGQLGPSTGRTGALNGNPGGETKTTLQNKRRRAYTEAEEAEFARLRRENLAVMNARSIAEGEARELENAKRQAARRRHTCPDDDDAVPEYDDAVLDDGFFAGANNEGRENNNGQHNAGQRSTGQSSTGQRSTVCYAQENRVCRERHRKGRRVPGRRD